MGRVKLISLIVGLVMILAGLAHAEKSDKVCVAHEGEESIENILISRNALEAHIAHGDSVVDVVNCIDVCIDHKGHYVAISAEELAEHEEHGDTAVDAELCLEK